MWAQKRWDFRISSHSLQCKLRREISRGKQTVPVCILRSRLHVLLFSYENYISAFVWISELRKYGYFGDWTQIWIFLPQGQGTEGEFCPNFSYVVSLSSSLPHLSPLTLSSIIIIIYFAPARWALMDYLMFVDKNTQTEVRCIMGVVSTVSWAGSSAFCPSWWKNAPNASNEALNLRAASALNQFVTNDRRPVKKSEYAKQRVGFKTFFCREKVLKHIYLVVIGVFWWNQVNFIYIAKPAFYL